MDDFTPSENVAETMRDTLEQHLPARTIADDSALLLIDRPSGGEGREIEDHTEAARTEAARATHGHRQIDDTRIADRLDEPI